MVSQGWLNDSCPSASMQSASQVPSLPVGGISSKQHTVARAGLIFLLNFFYILFMQLFSLFMIQYATQHLIMTYTIGIVPLLRKQAFFICHVTPDCSREIYSSSRPYKCFPTNLAAITAVRKPICTSHKYNPDKVGSGSLSQQDGRSCSPVVDPWKPQQQQMKTVRRKGGVRSCTTCTNIIQIFIFNVLICNLTS